MGKLIGTKMSLLSKILLLDVIMVGALMILSVGLSARYSVGQLESGQKQNLHNMAQILATSEPIIKALQLGRSNPELDLFLDSVIFNQNNVDVITLADMNSIRIYHPDRARVGEHFIGGDEGRALKGEHYQSQAVGTLGFQNRYFYPVYNKDGTQIGFAHVSQMMSNFNSLRSSVIRVHLQTLAIALMVGVLAAGVLTMSIKRSLLGYEPDQIARIFLQRGEVMDSLEEGLLAVDEQGSIILVNEAAEKMLEITAKDSLGKDVDVVIPQIGLKESLGGSKDYNRPLIIREESILYDRIPISSDRRLIGAMAIMRDRSEVTRMAEQLTGVKHLLDALRANTHEFMNRLHVILGLLQAGDVDEAKRFIMDIGQLQSETVSALAKNIENRALAALILGKINRCNELGIWMHVMIDSAIPRHSCFLPTKALITIVGNLVENAIEAINERGPLERKEEIALLIYEDSQSLLITLDDTGVGLASEDLEKLRQPGYTTKGSGRGTGMGLIRGVLENYQGKMSIESERGVGTSITLIFQVLRHERHLAGGGSQMQGRSASCPK